MIGERRRYPRVTVDMPLEFVEADGTTLSATLVSLSHSGLEAACDHWTARRVSPPGYQTTPSHNIQTLIRFTLPGDDTVLEATCRVVVCRRLSRDAYRMGLQYTALGDGVRARLERFLGGCPS